MDEPVVVKIWWSGTVVKNQRFWWSGSIKTQKFYRDDEVDDVLEYAIIAFHLSPVSKEQFCLTLPGPEHTLRLASGPLGQYLNSYRDFELERKNVKNAGLLPPRKK